MIIVKNDYIIIENMILADYPINGARQYSDHDSRCIFVTESHAPHGLPQGAPDGPIIFVLPFGAQICSASSTQMFCLP